MDNKQVIILLLVGIVVGAIGFYAYSSMTGYAVKSQFCLETLCERGETWNANACRCVPEAKGLAYKVNDCQTKCGIGSDKEIIIKEALVEEALVVTEVLVENVADGTCDYCNDGCKNQPDDCATMLCATIDPVACCESELGLTWCPAESSQETTCMRTCLGVPSENAGTTGGGTLPGTELS